MTRIVNDLPGYRPRQQGAALVVVMVVLASALMLGVVGIQSALIDQRLAGNYRASLTAQMRAESAAAEGLAAFDSLDWDNALTLSPDQRLRWPALSRHSSAVHQCHERSCLYLPVLRQDERWVLALGIVHAGNNDNTALAAHSEPVFVRAEGDDAEQRRWE